MDKAQLAERQHQLEARFKELQAQSDQKRSEIQDIENELIRLQGRHAELADLIKQLPEVSSPPETTITAEPVAELVAAEEVKRSGRRSKD